MNAARMYGHTGSIAMTDEAIFTIINDRNNLNDCNFNSNGYRNNHDSTKNNDNSNMINSKNDTFLIHIKLRPTLLSYDITSVSDHCQIKYKNKIGRASCRERVSSPV